MLGFDNVSVRRVGVVRHGDQVERRVPERSLVGGVEQQPEGQNVRVKPGGRVHGVGAGGNISNGLE